MQAPKYRKLAELQDQLDRTTDAIGNKLLMVAMLLIHKMVVTLGLRMRYPYDLTGGSKLFSLAITLIPR